VSDSIRTSIGIRTGAGASAFIFFCVDRKHI
jgi:hypothetical protein